MIQKPPFNTVLETDDKKPTRQWLIWFESIVDVVNGLSTSIASIDHDTLVDVRANQHSHHHTVADGSNQISYLDLTNTPSLPSFGTFTDGSVIFSDGSTLSEDNANFFWDRANLKLKVRTEIVTPLIGTNLADNLVLETNSIQRWLVKSTGHLFAKTTNIYDIGDSAATGKPRTLYLGTSLFTPDATISNMTSGSVLFAGTGGLVSQSNTNFFWDIPNFRLGIGKNTPIGKLDIRHTFGSGNDDNIIHIDGVPSVGGAAQRVVGLGMTESAGPTESGKLFLYSNGVLGFVVETYTGNPSYYKVGSGGKFGFGTKTPGFPVTLDSVDNNLAALNPTLVIQGVDNKERLQIRSSVASIFTGSRFNGTLASPTAVISGDILSAFGGGGYDGSIFVLGNRASVNSFAGSNWSGTNNEAYLTLVTTPNAATAGVERWRVQSAGHFVGGLDNTYDIGNSGAVRPRTIYVGTSVITPTLTVSSAVSNDSGGFKHQSVSTGSIAGGASAAVTLTWATAFANASYTPICSLVEATTSTSTLRIHHIESFSATQVVVRVVNDDGAIAKTGTLYVMGVHQ